MNTVTTTGDYVSGGGNVVLDITVGDGQLGTIRIRLNGAVIAQGQGHVRKALGTGAGSCRARTVVNRMSPSSNATVTYQFSGGAAPAVFVGEGDFGGGEPIIFVGDFQITQEGA